MRPDFSKSTITTLAQRASYICSNPDCRIVTVGPNSDDTKATVIGEAAHIFAARPGQARYGSSMSDVARAEISNGIWLCRNCHGLIDRDEKEFPAELLFQWRRDHEAELAKKLGSPSATARAELEFRKADKFSDYPPLVQRIVLDKPGGWEYRLTAELMRSLNEPVFRDLADLRDGLYSRSMEHFDHAGAARWIADRNFEMGEMVGPLARIIERFNEAWGAPGQPGDADEILHCCLRLRDALRTIVKHEEEMRFVRFPDVFDELLALYRGAMGSQIEQFKTAPDRLDDLVARALDAPDDAEPIIVSHTFDFALPDNWERDVSREYRKISKQAERQTQKDSGGSSGCLIMSVVMVVGFMVFLAMLG